MGPFKEEGGDENVKEEPDLVVSDTAAAAAAGPLISRSREEAAIRSVLTELHAAQRERMLVMEQEEREKVPVPSSEVCYQIRSRVFSGSVLLAYGSGSGLLFQLLTELSGLSGRKIRLLQEINSATL